MRIVRLWCLAAAVAGFVSDRAGLATIAAAPPSASQLETLYRRIDAQRNLSLAEKYEAKLQAHKASLEAGQAYLDALENLQKYSAIAGDAAEILRPESAAALQQFSQRLEKAADNPVFKQFGNFVQAEGYAAEAVKLVSELDEIGHDSNLPPSARRSLQALRGAAAALSRAGDVPLAGPVLETYGACLKELTTAVRRTAQHVTSLKGGGFSLTEQKELLAGLADGAYRRTALFEQGLPVVEETIREQGAERVYLQVEPGRWTEISARLTYPQLVALVQDFRILHDGRNPTPQEIVHYVARPNDRRDLAERALFEAEFRLTRALRDDIAPGMDFRKFDDAQDRLRERLAALGLPIAQGSSSFRALLQAELKQAGSYDALLRRMALDLTPYAREYLRSRGAANPDAVSLADLEKFLAEYRRVDPEKFVAWLATQDTTKIAGATEGKPAAGGEITSTTPAEQAPPKDEQTEKLQRRAKELAEKGLKPRDPAAPIDPNEAKPIIPEDCVIEIVGWGADKEAPDQPGSPIVYRVRNGRIEVDEGPTELSPASEDLTFKMEKQEQIHKLRAKVTGNLISGTDEWTYLPYQTWGWEGNSIERTRGKLTSHSQTKVTVVSRFEFLLYADGTLNWTTSVTSTTETQFFIPTSKGETFRRTPQEYTLSGAGVWQLRKSETVPSDSKDTPR